jgi:NAD(P)-dependent dehydrogenase (short-subunit alcohol dehydrogenase family)
MPVDVRGKVVVVTGGGQGIGRALCERFAAAGAATTVVADIDGESARQVAASIPGGNTAVCDVGRRDQLDALIDRTEREFGPIGLFCSNAAVFGGGGSAGLSDTSGETWDAAWRVNVMAHVWAAARLVPAMTARGGGYFLQVLSAAGLITGPSGLSYTVTKHAGVGFAEWLVINHGRDGIGVSCLCPTAVATPHFLASQAAAEGSDAGIMRNIGLLQTPEEVADAAIEGLAREYFLILPNPRVGRSFLHKAEDYDRWLAHTRDRVAGLKAANFH